MWKYMDGDCCDSCCCAETTPGCDCAAAAGPKLGSTLVFRLDRLEPPGAAARLPETGMV